MLRTFIMASIWVIAWIIIFELGFKLIAPYAPQSIQRYLDYGLSIEAKLEQSIGTTIEDTDFVKRIGWLDPESPYWGKGELKATEASAADHTLIAFYGMSFVLHVAQAVQRQYDTIDIRFMGGPAAPPNHSYAMWQLDRSAHQADIVVLGISSSGVRGMKTMTSLSKNFEAPLPFTYPTFFVADNQLHMRYPPITRLSDFQATFHDPERWAAYRAYLQQQDGFYHPFLFRANILDQFALTRFFRRGIALRASFSANDGIYDPVQGFETKGEPLIALNLMIADFAQQVRAKGRFPVILLFALQGYNDALYQALAHTLELHAIPFVNSFPIADSNDPRNFIADGHFTHVVDDQLAQALLHLLAAENELKTPLAYPVFGRDLDLTGSPNL